jgi:hypothetical protein
MASPPDNHDVYTMSMEFGTWDEAMEFVNEEI